MQVLPRETPERAPHGVQAPLRPKGTGAETGQMCLSQKKASSREPKQSVASDGRSRSTGGEDRGRGCDDECPCDVVLMLLLAAAALVIGDPTDSPYVFAAFL